MVKETVRGKFIRLKQSPAELYLITTDEKSPKNFLLLCDEKEELSVPKKIVWMFIDKGEFIIQ